MQRILIACVAMMALVGSANAGFHDDHVQRLQDMHCAAEAELAASIMMLRQKGAPMAMALGEEPSDRVRAFVTEAYEAPRETTEAARLRAAEEFGNQAALACHERVSGGQNE